SSTRSSRPRCVTCGEIGMVAKIAAANSRPMTDHAFMSLFPFYAKLLLALMDVPQGQCTGTLEVPGLATHTSPKTRTPPRGDTEGRGLGNPLALCSSGTNSP